MIQRALHRTSISRRKEVEQKHQLLLFLVVLRIPAKSGALMSLRMGEPGVRRRRVASQAQQTCQSLTTYNPRYLHEGPRHCNSKCFRFLSIKCNASGPKNLTISYTKIGTPCRVVLSWRGLHAYQAQEILRQPTRNSCLQIMAKTRRICPYRKTKWRTTQIFLVGNYPRLAVEIRVAHYYAVAQNKGDLRSAHPIAGVAVRRDRSVEVLGSYSTASQQIIGLKREV